MIEYKFKNADGSINVLVKTDAIAMDYKGRFTVMSVQNLTDANITAGLDVRQLDVVDEVHFIALASTVGAGLTKTNKSESSNVNNSGSVTFTVVDNAGSPAPIEEALVTIAGVSIETDADGVAIFESVAGGARGYVITKLGYTTATGSVNVSGDTEKGATLPINFGVVTFTVRDDAQSPELVEGASVTLAGETIMTGSDGKAIFDFVVNGANQNFTVSKTGYDTVNSTVTVSGDTSKAVTLPISV